MNRSANVPRSSGATTRYSTLSERGTQHSGRGRFAATCSTEVVRNRETMSISSSSLLVTLVIVTGLNQQRYVVSDEYRAACRSRVCPTVTWIDGAAGEMTEFALTSSQRDGSENWVSFAFADKPTMLAAQFVVDCYDLGGLLHMGASRNSLAPIRTNKDSPADKAKLTNSTITVHRGVYNCTFLMNLPSKASYVIMAEGKLHPAGNMSSPRKKGHGSTKWASTRAYRFASTASNATPADDGAVYSADDNFVSIGADSAVAVTVAGSPNNGLADRNAAIASEYSMTISNTAASKSNANSATSLTPSAMLPAFLALATCAAHLLKHRLHATTAGLRPRSPQSQF